MIVNLTREQLNQIINMIENASFKGSASGEVEALLTTLRCSKKEEEYDSKANDNVGN